MWDGSSRGTERAHVPFVTIEDVFLMKGGYAICQLFLHVLSWLKCPVSPRGHFTSSSMAIALGR